MNPPDYSHSFNAFVYDAIPPKSVCLDVGCWNGNLGKALTEQKKCIVDGVDSQPDMLQRAKKNGYRRTFLVNFNNDTYDVKKLEKYDVIVCADVLEHLLDPVAVLKELKKHLRKNGRIIISLPNIGFFLYRLQLLLGKWEYREFGTLDKTHIKFYTIVSGKQMVASSGLSLVSVKPYNQFGMLRYITPLDDIFPSLLAYQFLIIAEA